jgi:uncharacterized protein (DUF849 family)
VGSNPTPRTTWSSNTEAGSKRHSTRIRTSPLLEAALNGSRDHPKVPRTPADLADDARACVDAGARVLHVHAFDRTGHQTLHAKPCAATVRALHSACPGIPVSLTTFAEVERDPLRRLELVKSWTVLPDLVTANQGEEGIVDVCRYLIMRGVGIEAALLSVEDAQLFLRSGLLDHCARVLVEPLESDPKEAVAHADFIERVLVGAGVSLEQVHHGDGVASWAVSERGLRRGHGMRTGLEDTPVLPNGKPAPNNASLVRAASKMISTLHRPRNC